MNDFSDPDYINRRYGHLTIIGYEHGQFIAKCDCGFTKPIKCSAIINRKTSTCGRVVCDYHVKDMDYWGKTGRLIAEKGEQTEKDVCEYLKKLGYTVKKTQRSGDYGVDLICVGKRGELVAIQVKNNASTKSKANVHAVQEVYAGGKFYDCEKFAVVSYTGYTDNAKRMADKLGVMLCNEKCELFKEEEHLPINTKHTWFVDGHEEAMTTTFKRNGWNFSHIERFVDMTYEQTKDYFLGLEKKKYQVVVRKQQGISQQKVAYRMKHMGMTFEQAVSEPNRTKGRPRKKSVSA